MTVPTARPVVLMLAAGSARRFGSDKRRALLYKHETLLDVSLQSYLGAGFDVCVCLSSRAADDDLAARLATLPLRVLRCRRAGEGMGATLAEGILACTGYPGAFIALADMPALRAATLQLIEAASALDRIVFPTFEGRRGHPVFFGAAWFTELAGLGGDRGAADLLARNAAACVPVPVDDPGVLLDVDTTQALAALRRSSAFRD